MGETWSAVPTPAPPVHLTFWRGALAQRVPTTNRSVRVDRLLRALAANALPDGRIVVGMLDQLRREVLEANLELIRRGLVIYTFGNASGFSPDEGLVVIKPSGVAFDDLTADNMVVTDLTGRVVEGRLRPSSDLDTHLVLYRAYPQLGGVVHTHSRFATAWAQAGREIPCLGTTHADYFHSCVPLTSVLTDDEIGGEYERATGEAILRRYEGMDPMAAPGVLVVGHGPFTWGKTPMKAAQNAVLLEEIAAIAYHTVVLHPDIQPLGRALHDRHFLRKHGPGAYYGQGGES